MNANNVVGPGQVAIPNPPLQNARQEWSCVKRIVALALSALLSLTSFFALPFPLSLLGAGLSTFILLKWGFKNNEGQPVIVQNPVGPAVPVPVYVPQPAPVPFWTRAFQWVPTFFSFNPGPIVADPRPREGVGDGHINRLVNQPPNGAAPFLAAPRENARNVLGPEVRRADPQPNANLNANREEVGHRDERGYRDQAAPMIRNTVPHPPQENARNVLGPEVNRFDPQPNVNLNADRVEVGHRG